MVEVSIRTYRTGDGAACADVLFLAVREGALTDYSPEQVAAWVPVKRSAEWFDRRSSDGRMVLVAEHKGRVIAYIDVETNGHIDHAFCLPEFIGRGVASRLYDAIELHASTAGMTSLSVEASEAARRLFLRKGFTEIKRNQLVRGDVVLHNFDMRKDLSPPARP